MIQITTGEKLFVERRRAGRSQAQQAKKLKVNIKVYCQLERQAEGREIVKDLTVAEACTLLRRRNGLTQANVALDMGVTRFWVRRMELGISTVKRLQDFWGL